MAGKISGITVAIEADTTGLAKSLKDVTNESIQLSKDLKTVNQLLKLDPSNADLIAEKQKILAKSIETTKEKLEALKAAQEDVKRQYENGEISTEQYLAYQKEVVETENRLQGLEEQLNDTGEAATKSEKNFDGLKNVLGTVAKAAAATIAAMATAAGAATKALVDMTVAGAAYADEILTESTVTGIATDKLQEYKYAAELVDVSTETLTKSMAKNIKSMASAAKGTGDTAAAYKKLGVEVTNSDGSLRDSEEVYWELIDALGNVENETERDAMAMQILGKSAQDLNPLIEAGADRMKELGEQAHDAGYVLSDETLNAFGEFDDQLQYLKVGAEAAKNALGTALLPTLTSLATDGVSLLNEFSSGLVAANGDVGKMADVFGELIPKIVDKISAYIPDIMNIAETIISSLATGLLNNLPLIVQSATDIVLNLADGLITALPQIVDVALQAIEILAFGLVDAFPTMIPQLVQVVMDIVDTLIAHVDMLIDAALQIIIALADGIIQSLPVLIEKAPVIIDRLVSAIVNNLPKILQTGATLIFELVKGILQSLPQIAGAAGEVVMSLISGVINLGANVFSAAVDIMNQFKNGLMSMIKNAAQWGKDLITNFIGGIKSKASALKDSITNVANTIKSKIGFSEPESGPLSNFHTYAPDMMELFAKGIKENAGLITSAFDSALTGIGTTAATDGMNRTAARPSAGIGNMSISVNVNQISNDYDVRRLAMRIGEELNSITASNTLLVGGAIS